VAVSGEGLWGYSAQPAHTHAVSALD
jgi:hypothetical protein